MTVNSNTPLPRRKRNILWYIFGGLLLLLAVFIYRLFGPDPPITISPQTTYITQPLGPDGLPNYRAAILEQSRQGITPENNAAVLIFTALWPGELSPNEFAPIAQELGLSIIPPASDSLVSVFSPNNRKELSNWLEQQPNLNLTKDSSSRDLLTDYQSPIIGKVNLDADDNTQSLLELAVARVADQACSRPWTSAQIPPLATWLQANQKPLDMLVEASRRPRCYFPSPSLIGQTNDPLISILMPGQQLTREITRSLAARAMWHIGENQNEKAWQDLLALHRIARLIAQGPFLLEQFIGMHFEGVAFDRTLELLNSESLSRPQIKQIRDDLAGLPPFNGVTETISSDRLMAIDTTINFATSNGRAFQEFLTMFGIDLQESFQLLKQFSVDWNEALIHINQTYDQLAAAARIADRDKRDATLKTIYAKLNTKFVDPTKPQNLLMLALSRQLRSDTAAAIMSSTLIPSVEIALNLEDQANLKLQLLQLAAAISEYRILNNEYPSKLNDLVPSVLTNVPTDTMYGTPYVYHRDGEGYLLYSLGANGQDDGGSNQKMKLHAGRSIEPLDTPANSSPPPAIPADADDISIRMPRPAFKMP